MIKYPDFVDVETLIGTNVHVIELYEPGYSVHVLISDDDMEVKVSDWNLNIINEFNDQLEHAIYVADSMSGFMYSIGLRKYQIFLDLNMNLVDVVANDEKFISPGMLKLLFSNYSLQKMIENKYLSNEDIGRFKNCIIKGPSNSLEPSYAKIL
jgi:hypothetical protein